VGHRIAECKARVVFEGEEVVVDNKDIKQYAIQHPTPQAYLASSVGSLQGDEKA
jgi:hypothetical protein